MQLSRALKVKINGIVRKNLGNGQLTKPTYCQLCHKRDTLLGHHCDYEQPLNVYWVCRHCHNRLHQIPVLYHVG